MRRLKSYVLGANGEAGAVLVEVDEVSLHVPAHQRHDDPHSPPHSTLNTNSQSFHEPTIHTGTSVADPQPPPPLSTLNINS
jgi:hypothetical protein